MTLEKLRKEIASLEKRRSRLEGKLFSDFLGFNAKRKIERKIDVLNDRICLAKKEFNMLLASSSMQPSPPHTVSKTDEKHFSLLNIFKK